MNYNLPPNFDFIKDYLEFMKMPTLRSMMVFYYIRVNLDNIDWNYTKYSEQYHSKTYINNNSERLLLTEFEHISYNSGTKVTTKITEELLYVKLATLTKEQIKIGFSNSKYIDKRVARNDYLTILNKYNEAKFTILRSDFKKYCGFYQEIKQFGKLSNTLVLNLEFDQLTADLVAVVLTKGIFNKSLEFEQTINTINLLKYLLVNLENLPEDQIKITFNNIKSDLALNNAYIS